MKLHLTKIKKPNQNLIMKKITTLVLMLVAFSSFAQRSIPVASDFAGVKFSNATRSISDTLYPLSYTTQMSCTLTVYGVVGDSGYVVGTNGYGDKEKAQRYDLFNYSLLEGNVTGAYIWAGAKVVSTTPGNVVCKVYTVGGSGAPGSVLATSDPVSMDLIDTSGSNLTYFNFATPGTIPASGSFFVSMVMSTTVGDTIGLVSSNDGCYENSGYSWEMWSNNTWHSFLAAWPLDFDIAVFPIVDHQFGASVNNLNSGILGVNVYPNPSNDQLTVSLAMNQSTTVTFRMMNAAGQEVLNSGAQSISKGIQTSSLDVSSLSNGVYLLSVETESGKSVQRISIVR